MSPGAVTSPKGRNKTDNRQKQQQTIKQLKTDRLTKKHTDILTDRQTDSLALCFAISNAYWQTDTYTIHQYITYIHI